MSVDPRPPQNLLARHMFLRAWGETKKPPDPTVSDPYYWSDQDTNTNEATGKNNMIMVVSSAQEFDAVLNLGLEFKTTASYGGTAYGESAAPDDTGVGASIIGAAANTSDMSGTGTSSYTTNFWMKASQDANGNQFQEGLGATFENDLFEQTFTAVYSDLPPPDEEWIWTAGSGSTTPVTISLTGPEIDWSLYPNYVAEIKFTTEHGPIEMWNGYFIWVNRTGWFDPVNPIWYPDTATVTIRQLIGKGGTAPTYSSPQEYLDLMVAGILPQTAFKPTAITPAPVAYS